jgi:hypothetical protein
MMPSPCQRQQHTYKTDETATVCRSRTKMAMQNHIDEFRFLLPCGDFSQRRAISIRNLFSSCRAWMSSSCSTPEPHIHHILHACRLRRCKVIAHINYAQHTLHMPHSHRMPCLRGVVARVWYCIVHSHASCCMLVLAMCMPRIFCMQVFFGDPNVHPAGVLRRH